LFSNFANSQNKDYFKIANEQEINKNFTSKFGTKIEYNRKLSERFGVGLTYHYSNNFKFDCKNSYIGQSNQIGINSIFYPKKLNNLELSCGIENGFSNLRCKEKLEKNKEFKVNIGTDFKISKNVGLGLRYENGFQDLKNDKGTVYFRFTLGF